MAFYMIADSIIAGIISFLVLLLRDANCISSKYLTINKDYRINDKLLVKIAQNEMPNIAFFNSLVFIAIRMIYVFS